MNRDQKGVATPGLSRQLGVLTLTATGICSMFGASIYVVPFMIQRNVPGIGQYVLPAFLYAAIPAILAALAYAMLASAMPRAGGSYIYTSRGLHPYLGFIASFSQWFGLSIVIGVIAYIIIPFVRDVFLAMELDEIATQLDIGWIRVTLALGLLWSFVLINILGAKMYERTLIPLMFLMFFLGTIVVVAGFYFDHQDFLNAIVSSDGKAPDIYQENEFQIGTFMAAGALLFSSFIGFDSIAQAGGEAKDPGKTLPRAIISAILIVGTFYFLFTTAVYHTVPWQYVAMEAMERDITAPGLLRYLLPAGLGVAILSGAAIALINDLPAMLLSVSRLMFAWAEDGIFPEKVTRVHPRYHTPHIALLISGVMASIGIVGSHFAGDFFLGIDIMVTSMMVNFLLICMTVITFPKRNPALAQEVKLVRKRKYQLMLGYSGVAILSVFLAVHTWKDMSSDMTGWYFHSTPVWLIVMGLGSLIYFYKVRKIEPVEKTEKFLKLPPQ